MNINRLIPRSIVRHGDMLKAALNLYEITIQRGVFYWGFAMVYEDICFVE